MLLNQFDSINDQDDFLIQWSMLIQIRNWEIWIYISKNNYHNILGQIEGKIMAGTVHDPFKPFLLKEAHYISKSMWTPECWISHSEVMGVGLFPLKRASTLLEKLSNRFWHMSPSICSFSHKMSDKKAWGPVHPKGIYWVWGQRTMQDT